MGWIKRSDGIAVVSVDTVCCCPYRLAVLVVLATLPSFAILLLCCCRVFQALATVVPDKNVVTNILQVLYPPKKLALSSARQSPIGYDAAAC